MTRQISTAQRPGADGAALREGKGRGIVVHFLILLAKLAALLPHT